MEERETTQPFCPVHQSVNPHDAASNKNGVLTKRLQFLADRFVEGECSICGYPDARGDQCDKYELPFPSLLGLQLTTPRCGNLLDPLEPEPEKGKADADEADAAPKSTGFLINPRCKLDGATPEKRKTKHLFLRLDALKDQIVDWFHKVSKGGSWSTNCIQITQSWIDKGLKPRGITRDLKWGVPIPTGLPGLDDAEYANKV